MPLTANRLDNNDPAAGQLASVCAFLGPEPVPDDLFTSAPAELAGELAALAVPRLLHDRRRTADSPDQPRRPPAVTLAYQAQSAVIF